MKPTNKMPLPVLLGPTAIGKTQLAVELAADFPDLIAISADSRQIFLEMDIGTAKPTREERSLLPHYFIDICRPDETYNAGRFGTEGRIFALQQIRQGKLPLVVGGSGLYLRSLLDGLFQGRVSDPVVKQQLQEQVDQQGLEPLWEELKQCDPEAAAKIHPNDRQRIVRALEVIRITGEPISELRKRQHPEIPFQAQIFGLMIDRKTLYERINLRVDRMIAEGLIEEVEALRKKGYGPELQSQKTVGYQEIHSFLDGHLSRTEAIELIKRNTRRFAKRQLTWFRRDNRIQWLPIDSPELWNQARLKMEEALRQIHEIHAGLKEWDSEIL